MEVDFSSSNAREYVLSLASAGRYLFTSRDAQAALGVSAPAAKLALNRLARQKILASPARGFYAIVPPEYRSLGCLPADQFIPELMRRQNLSYYAGLLSAAQYYGAAHYRPQEFQVFLAMGRRPIKCGSVRVTFMARKRLTEVPVQKLNTPRGMVTVSTPEATSLDLVGYQQHAGGLSNVATILAELAEQIDPDKLPAAAATAPVPWAQRLGYLLEIVGADEKTSALRLYVKKKARRYIGLVSATSLHGTERNRTWRIYINTRLEAELLP